MAKKSAVKVTGGSGARKGGVILEKSAGVVVFWRGVGEIFYLLIKAGYWEFPKGLVEAGEDERAAARREVWEETGLDVELVAGFREAVGYFYRRKDGGALVKKEVVYFLGEAASQTHRLSWEHQEARWVTFDEAMGLLDYQQSRDILSRAHEVLTAGGV